MAKQNNSNVRNDNQKVGPVAPGMRRVTNLMSGKEIDIAGDSVTMAEAAAALSTGLGRAIAFVQIPIAEVRKNSEDLATMFEWFERVGYDVDIDATAREFGIPPTRLEAWAQSAGV